MSAFKGVANAMNTNKLTPAEGGVEIKHHRWWNNPFQIIPWANGVLWTNSNLFANASVITNLTVYPPEVYFDFGEFSSGGGADMVYLSGITRDSSGNPLGNCMVQLFRTQDDLFVNEVISDNGGFYRVGSPYRNTQHYLVAYLAGSPDVAGTTLDTLVPN